MKPDDRATWEYEAPDGEVLLVPVRIVKVGPKRIMVETKSADGYRIWRWVNSDKLREEPS